MWQGNQQTLGSIGPLNCPTSKDRAFIFPTRILYLKIRGTHCDSNTGDSLWSNVEQNKRW